MVKRISALIGAIIVAGALSLTAVSPAQAYTSNDNLYFKVVRLEAPELRGVSKKTLKSSAKATCRYLRAGGTVYRAVEIAENNGLNTDTAVTLVAGAVVFYCPEEEAYL